MTSYNNVILIFGDGRNSGKTTLARKIISYFADKNIAIGAIKVSTHIHDSNLENISNSNAFYINIENNLNQEKDSSKLLKAGAKPVYFVQSADDYLEQAFNIIKEQNQNKKIWIVESGAARKIFKPALFIFTKKDDNSTKNDQLLQMADLGTSFKEGSFSLPFEIITNQLDIIANTLNNTDDDKF